MSAEAQSQVESMSLLLERGGGYYESTDDRKRFGSYFGLQFPCDKIRTIKGSERADWGVVPGWNCSDDDLKILSSFPGLEDLYVSGPAITDDGLQYLQHVPRITTLELRHTSVTDHGLDCLQKLPALKSLDLTGAKITDEAATTLSQLQSLRSLDLSETRISEHGVSRLVRWR